MSPESTERLYRVEVIDPTPEEWRAHSSCTLGISLGEHYHERGKFRATVEWVSERFSSCAIVLCDSLQRFNSPRFIQHDEQGALDDAVAAGDAWVARNKEALHSFSIPCHLTRWEEWRTHRDFPALHAQVSRLVQSDTGLRDTIERDVSRFISNNSLVVEGREISHESRLATGRSYMIEELAGLALFARTYGYFEIYAGPKISAIDYLQHHTLNGTPIEITRLRSVKIDFRRMLAAGSG